MNRLEHRQVLTVIGAGHNPQPANQSCTQVADHVAVQILQQQHVELGRVLHQLHASRIDDHLLVLDVRVLRLVHLPGTSQEQSVGDLHDVRLVEDGDLLPLAESGEPETPTGDPVAGRLGRHLHAHHHVRGDLVLNPAVKALGVLADDHQVHVV